MIHRPRKIVPLWVLLAVEWTRGCSAFVPPTFLPQSSSTAFKSGVSTTKSSSSSSGSALFMGLEDMLKKTDDTNRKKNNDAYIESLQKRVEQINALEGEYEELGDDELAAKTDEFRKRLKQGEDVNGKILEEAFAVVREAAWRVLEQRHYDVQLLGGIILHEGRLAEMATGEGKTLVSTLPCYLNSLVEDNSSFVITVNDYLARRDAEKMGQVHRFLGLSVGLIQAGMGEIERKVAYECDVTYVTNSELGFDYLRDHLALSVTGTVLPNAGGGSGEFDGFCVVDEADSVLIDEARTPLIISKQTPAPSQKYTVANQIANTLAEDIHYTVDLKNKNVILNDKGYRDTENALGIQSLFATGPDGSAWAPYVQNAVKAKELFNKDIEYSVVTDDNGEKIGVGIIDSFTGRVLDGRRWADGQHQSIEAKEGIAVSQQSKVIAKVTYQALFRQFSRLSGMTGTAASDAEELNDIYGLLVTPVPTALPIARRDYPDVAWKSRDAADNALIKEVLNVGGGQKDGRPCLIGTTSVRQSESIVAKLKKRRVNAELLNASPNNAARESEIIAQAGRAGVVTVATNMAGRGTDILLGGCASTMARLKVRSVLIKQLTGLMSEAEMAMVPPSPSDDYYPAEISEDILFLLQDAAKNLKNEFFDKSLTALKLEEILTVATDTTEGDDDPNYIVQLRDATEAIKEDTYIPVLAKEKEIIRAMGGLYVMGTNRHESRRIDNQLRGRAGRQGDPGTSRFFLSFQDDMFVIFGGDGLQNILKTFRVSDDMPVEAPQITEALDKVQVAVEEEYREIREQILNFDEVLNSQRRVIYRRRQNVLFNEPNDNVDLMKKYNEETVKEIVSAQVPDDGVGVNVDKVLEKVGQFFPPVLSVVTKEDLQGLDVDGVAAYINVAVDEIFKAKVDELEKNAKDLGNASGAMGRTAQYITLVSTDNAWSDHLQNMENLKETVILRKYQNLDPVAEYKDEALTQFQALDGKMRLNTVYSLWQSIGSTEVS